jgi:hypothetical protein
MRARSYTRSGTALLIVVFAAGCSSLPQWVEQPRPIRVLSGVEVDIVRAVLTDDRIRAGWGYPQHALLLDETQRMRLAATPAFLDVGGYPAPVESELVASARTASASYAYLPQATYPSDLTLYGWRAFQNGLWSHQSARYLAGLEQYVNVVSLSTPAVAPGDSKALIGINQYSPRKGCVLEYFVYLERRSQQWIVVATGEYVIS